MQVAQRRPDLADFARREKANPLLPEIDVRPVPDGRAFDRRGAHSVSPPSTMTVWPVTIAAPAHRKKITSQMSAGLQARLRGVFSIECHLRSTGHSCFPGLSTQPLAPPMIRTSGPRLRASLRDTSAPPA